MELFEGFYLKHLISIVIIIISATIIAKVIRYTLNKFIDKSSAKLRVDPTRYKFFKNAVTLIIYLFALITIIYVIPAFRHLAITLFAGAGIFAAIVGFASQNVFSSIVSGIFIVIFKPFRVGDYISFINNGTFLEGFIEDITLRHTVIRDFEHRRIVVPNNMIGKETIINSDIGDRHVCQFVEINISFDSDIDKASILMKEEAMKHKFYIDNRTDVQKRNDEHPVIVKVVELTEFGMKCRAHVWTKKPYHGRILKFDLYKSFVKRFEKEGIKVAYPYRVLVHKNQLPSQ